ncbi:unnamed protein product [Somion occarium]|uniref:RING-type domain-containing protein n=1 Tax=Somion occarium TaxID=3059160 RepID=A0ABP1E2Q8_9APHY
MPTCVICLDVLKNPAALPCGHVFCYECVVQLVRNVHPYVNQHFCPTCRQAYTIIPPHLQLHVSPSIRKLSLDYSVPKSTRSNEPLELECARLRAENQSLKNCCSVWCNRARLHARTTLGLIGMVRMGKDAALQMKAQRDEFEKQLTSLKRSWDERDTPPESSSPSDTSSPSVSSRVSAPLPRRHQSPTFSPSPFCPRTPSPCYSEQSYHPDCPDCQASTPPIKRQRTSEEPTLKIIGDASSECAQTAVSIC